jgi:hypothetical protein
VAAVVRVTVLCVLALTLAGCAAETPEQQAARELVEIHIAADTQYDGHVRCTRNPRPWFVSQKANVFICAARRGDGDCDWFRVTRGDEGATVALDSVRGGCVLPV